MKTGDVVIPWGGCRFILASGSARYTHAIVVSVEPFALVSEGGDMVWSATVKPEFFTPLCQAHPDIVAVAVARWNRDKPNPTGQGMTHETGKKV